MTAVEMQDRVTDQESLDRLCGAFHLDVPCLRPSVARGIAGCVHEHVRQVNPCEYHRQCYAADVMRCRPCLKAGHECRRSIVWDPS